ncbi:hypothetical protein GCK32_001886 [Trichostrongylus colubriformis]|uniref:Uncharacterized protein n=1 Tax=Trichostrongylus colubriformis TaxID=6319 RepID=A0AAN8IMS1_TRICO
MHIIRRKGEQKLSNKTTEQSNYVPSENLAPVPAHATQSVFIKPEMRDRDVELEEYLDNVKTAQLGHFDGNKKLGETGETPKHNIMQKTMSTVKYAAGRWRKGKASTPIRTKEDSIKTALSISTIPPQEAAKYSFLRKEEQKPALVPTFEEPLKSDIDLFCNCEEKPRLDMKNLEAFFNKPPRAGSAERKEQKRKSSAKKRRTRILKSFTKNSKEKSAELTAVEKSDKAHKPERKHAGGITMIFKPRKSRETTAVVTDGKKRCACPVSSK